MAALLEDLLFGLRDAFEDLIGTVIAHGSTQEGSEEEDSAPQGDEARTDRYRHE
jgi:hypothetical protein